MTDPAPKTPFIAADAADAANATLSTATGCARGDSPGPAATDSAGPSAEELARACERARAHGYDWTDFRFTVYRKKERIGRAVAALPDFLVEVSLTVPGIRPAMYRVANGDWIREFEHDLMAHRFDRPGGRSAA